MRDLLKAFGIAVAGFVFLGAINAAVNQLALFFMAEPTATLIFTAGWFATVTWGAYTWFVYRPRKLSLQEAQRLITGRPYVAPLAARRSPLDGSSKRVDVV